MANPSIHSRRALAAAWLLAAVSLTALASAQPRDPAAAQALFDEARSMMSSRRYAEACTKLEESQRLDPGLGTQFHLADCYEQSGRTASAWAAFLEVASLAGASGQTEREQAAQARAARLEGKLAKLIVEVPEANRVPDLQIRRNNVVLGQAQWGVAVPVDPGAHSLFVAAPGRKSLSLNVVARPGEHTLYKVPALEPDAAASRPEPVATLAPPTSEPAAPPATESADPGGGSSSKVLAYTLGGVGIVGLGVGTVFAILAKSQYEDSKADCRPDDPNRCNAQGLETRDAARAKGTIATVSLALGGALLAAGVVLFVIGDDGSEKAQVGAAVGPGSARLELAGSF